MKTVKTVTFHHAHNFGSMLQAYALQEFIKSLDKDIDYQIIDYYSELQERFYKVFKPWNSLKNAVKNINAIVFYKQLRAKHAKFEDFLREECSMSDRYKTLEEIERADIRADYFISGSDQLWNVRAKDFSDVFYLPFVRSGKKIAYAASFGPLKIDWNQYNREKYAGLLAQYQSISAREAGSGDNVRLLTGETPQVNVDPTVLLSADQWREIESDANYNDGEYILMYCLEPSKAQLAIADAISKKLKLPIVITKYNNKNDMINHFVKKYDAGPRDFLAYIDHAKLVLTSSFHGTAFSLIFNKPFYAFNGMADNRISDILRITGMEERSINSMADVERVSVQEPDREKVQKLLAAEVDRSRDYLKRCLEIE